MNVFKFFTPNCSGCKSLEITLDSLTKRFYTRGEVEIIPVNAQMVSQDVLELHGIKAVPALSIRKNDGTYDTLLGWRGSEKTKAWIDSHLGELP